MSDNKKNKDITNNNNNLSYVCNDNKNKMMIGKTTRSQSIHSLPPTRLPLAATNNNNTSTATNNKNEKTNYNKLKSSNRSNLP